MFGALPYKTKQFFFLLIKLSIIGGAIYFIYEKLAKNENLDFSVFIDFLIKNDIFSIKNVLFLLLLTIFNWFFEILKWKNLVLIVKKITITQAMKQSLAALTTSLFTPNRMGDYAAKVAYYSKGQRKRVLMLNLISHMAQMCATLLFGIIGLIMFANIYGLDMPIFRLARLGALFIILFLFSVIAVRQNKYRIKGFSISKVIDFIRRIPLNTKISTLLYSALRYLIFSFQFFALLVIFKIDVSYSNAMIVITTMYLLSSVVPTIFLFDVVVKGSIALYLFDIVGVNNLTVLSVITSMWILNFVLPGIIGSFYVLSFRPNIIVQSSKD